jgi:6-pyruvoyltetrahydropterin/6-carboxytetrahydropterin synthase
MIQPKDTMLVGKSYIFSAAHFIPFHPKCGKMHGHTYKVTVEITGCQNKDGMVIDFSILNEKVNRTISPMDHVALNDLFLFPPTCENLAKFILEVLVMTENLNKDVEDIYSIGVTVQEGEGGYASAEMYFM